MSSTDETSSNASDFPSAKEMEGWLKREITDSTKALELRIKDATEFVGAYSRGEISAEEAAERGSQYTVRWGDPLPGVSRSQGLSDEEILSRMDEAKKRFRVQSKRGASDPHSR